MTGMIDLTYVRDGRWYVLDYKSNRLPGWPDLLAIAMRHSEYDLQALIYTVACIAGCASVWARPTITKRDMGASATCSAAAWMLPATACMDRFRSRWWMHSTRCSQVANRPRPNWPHVPVGPAHEPAEGTAPEGPAAHPRSRVGDQPAAAARRRPSVALAAALASLAVSLGHAAFDPAQPQRLLEGVPEWPRRPGWRSCAHRHGWPHRSRLTPSPRMRRWCWKTACSTCAATASTSASWAGLQRIGRHPLPAPDMAALVPLFAQLFPQALNSEDHQARSRRDPAPSAGTGHRRPGTGKTTTIARLLLLLAAQARHAGQPLPEVALAAPTGRAAERMAESLRVAVQRLQEQEWMRRCARHCPVPAPPTACSA